MKLGFLGTGIMGAPMAVHLARGGHEVRAWNRDRGKVMALTGEGVRVADDPADASRDAEIVLCMLSSDAACDAVLPQAMAVMMTGATLVVMSSISVDKARALAAAAAGSGLGWLDAPVSGGENGAKAASLAIMAGGEASVFDRLIPILSLMGRPTLIGPAGTGALAKLANQMIVAGTIALVAEAFLLVSSGGADPAKLREALAGGFADSIILQNHGLRMIEQNFAPGGPAKYQVKDARAALSVAQALDLRLPVATAVAALFDSMVAAGDGELDHSGVIRELSRINGRNDGPLAP